MNRLLGGLPVRAEAYWAHQFQQHGVRGAWPGLVREARDPITALRIAGRALGGIYIGDRLRTSAPEDPRRPRAVIGSVVIPSELSWVIEGTPNSGKTKTVLVPGVLQEVAAGDNVILVTPQDETVDSVYALGNHLVRGRTRLVDFGGRIVKPPTPAHASPRFVTWDPTRSCAQPDEARWFGRAFAGPDAPFRKDLGEGANYWGQLPEKLFTAAAHIVAIQRAIAGLDPDGRNGMSHVLYYLGGLEGGNMPATELTGEQSSRLKAQGLDPAEIEQSLRKAADFAGPLHPQVRRLGFDAAFLAHQGQPVDDSIAGAELQRVSKMLTDYEAHHGGGNPLTQLLSSAEQVLPQNEVRVMSPHPGEPEISPEQLAGGDGDGSLTIISYAQTRLTGVGPGVLAGKILAISLDTGVDSKIAQRIGGDGTRTGTSMWIDEGSALRHMGVDTVDTAITDGRQLRVSTKILTTSEAHLKRDVGAERAATLIDSAPVRVNLTPDTDQAAALSRALPHVKVSRTTTTTNSQRGAPGPRITQRSTSESIEPAVRPDELARLPRGQAVVVDRAATDGSRVKLVKLPGPDEAGTPVGDANRYAKAIGLPGPPWHQMRPDIADKLRWQDPAVEPDVFKRTLPPPEPRPTAPAEDPARRLPAPPPSPSPSPAAGI